MPEPIKVPPQAPALSDASAILGARTTPDPDSYSPDISNRGSAILEGHSFLHVLRRFKHKDSRSDAEKVLMRTPEGKFVQSCIHYIAAVVTFTNRLDNDWSNRGVIAVRAENCDTAALPSISKRNTPLNIKRVMEFPFVVVH